MGASLSLVSILIIHAKGFNILDLDITEHAPLKITTEWIDLEVLSEADVLLTYKGYAPILLVRVVGKKIPRVLYINAKSIATQLEEMRSDNKGNFTGLKFRIRKTGPEKTAVYELG